MSYRFNDDYDENVYSYQPNVKDGKVQEVLPAGVYNFIIPMMGPPQFTEMNMNFDELVRLEGGVYSKIRGYIGKFASAEGKAAHKVLGTLWKTGILLYGRPGTGKTSLMHQLIDWVIAEHNAIVVYGPKVGEYPTLVDIVRDGDPDRLIVIVADEFEEIAWHYEHEILNFLDGHQSKTGVIYLGATNYMHKISDRIKNRPSRFNFITEIPLPSTDHRIQILEAKLPKEAQKLIDIEDLAEKTHGLTIDHVKAVMSYMLVYEKSLEESIEIAKQFSEVAKDYEYGKKVRDPDYDDDDDDDDD